MNTICQTCSQKYRPYYTFKKIKNNRYRNNSFRNVKYNVEKYMLYLHLNMRKSCTEKKTANRNRYIYIYTHR